MAPASADHAQPGPFDDRAAAFGRLIALMMSSPKHANMTLAQANGLIGPALTLGQVAFMGARSADDGPVAIAAAVWWAYVSPEVDARLTASIEPHLRLLPNDWKSGDQPWLIDAIGDPKIVHELVKRIAQRHPDGKALKLRAQLPDGRTAVGRLEPRPANDTAAA